MPVVSLTDLTVRNLKPVPGKQVTYLDRSLKGFGVRVSPGGRAIYVLVMGANRQRVKIGQVGVVKLADARTTARNMLAHKQLGANHPTASLTYEAALQIFLNEKEESCKPRTFRDYKRLLTRHGFRKEKLSAIGPADVQGKIDKLRTVPGERAHAYAVLQIFFRFAFRRHLIDRNPMERMDVPPKGKARARILTNEELKAVWSAATGMFGDIIKLCILLGQRRSEIATLQWDWIKGDLITLPPEVTKNKREHTFPVGPMAKAIINAQTRWNDTSYLFPARKTWRSKSTVYNAWGKDMPKLRKASETTGWVIHDCRRTFRSKWAELAIIREVSEKYINHISGTQAGVEGIYDRYSYLSEMRHATASWESYLQNLLNS